MMERHPDSSQTFLPVDVARYLVIVAPNGSIDRPDMTQARAFLARGDQGVTYRPGAWHHGMTVFDRAGRFVVLMWVAGDGRDEEFHHTERPIAVSGLDP
jgi:ureidoglycolate lyase